jgi:hypothetical protein
MIECAAIGAEYVPHLESIEEGYGLGIRFLPYPWVGCRRSRSDVRAGKTLTAVSAEP